MKKVLTTLTVIVAALSSAWGQDVSLCGSVVSADVSYTPGVYRVPLKPDGELKFIGKTEKATGGGFLYDGNYYAAVLNNSVSYYGNCNIYPYSTEDWTMQSSAYISGYPANVYFVSDHAVDPTTNTIYGCGSDKEDKTKFNLNIYKYDLATTNSEHTTVGALPRQLGAMAFDAAGQLYALDETGKLYKADKASAALTEVGATGIAALKDGAFAPFIHASAIIDPKTGTMYVTATAASGTCSLWSVDTTTATATKLRDFPAGVEVNGIYLGEPEANASAPAAASDLAVHFEGASLTGRIEFKAPTTTYSGDPISENLSFRVLANDAEVATGKVYSGVEKSVDITVPERGEYTFNVIMSNASGDGPAAKLKATVGYAAPAAPVVTAVVESGMYSSNVHITWDAVTTTEDGASLDGAAVSYRVVRYPDGKVLEESTTYPSVYDYSLPSGLSLLEYGVTAIANDTPSQEGRSAKISVGKAGLPYEQNFASEDDVAYFTNIDANNDGKQWTFYSGEMSIGAPADDWLITPQLDFGASYWPKYYTVSLDARVRSADQHGTFEIRYGNEATPEGLDSVAVGTFTVGNEDVVTARGLIKSSSSAPAKYVGIHATTGSEGWTMLVTNLRISAAYEGEVPAAPTMTVTPDISGALKADFSIVLPAKNLDGDTLSSLEKVEVFCDSVSIHTAKGVTPGQTITFSSDFETGGKHTFTAVVTNSAGAGIPAEKQAFIGINLPASPASAFAFETANDGEVTIEWEPVTTYIDGTPLDPANVTYSIYTSINGTDTKILTDLTGTSTTFQSILPDEPQLFFSYGVTASTTAGENLKGPKTDMVALGKPYTAPFADSFANLNTDYLWVSGGSDTYTYWDLAGDATFEDVVSFDGDGGMMAMYGSGIGSRAHLYSAKIDLAGLEKPVLSFYLFNLFDTDIVNTNTLELYIKGRNDRDFALKQTYKFDELGTEEGWKRMLYNLDEYKDQSIQVMFIGEIKRFQYMHLDNVQIRDRYDHDVELCSITAPERVKAGNSAEIAVSYANRGLEAAPALTLTLYRGEEAVATEQLPAMASDVTGTHTFSVLHAVNFPETVSYHAEIAYDADMVKDNNVTASVDVMTMLPGYPAVSDLKATYSADKPTEIALTWSAPDTAGTFSDEICEDFENGITWTNQGLEGWTFIDNDKFGIYGFNFFEVPADAPQPLTQQSWWVLDDTYRPMVEHFSKPDFYRAHSGHKYLVSMAVTDSDYNEKRSDDWAISPKLNGRRQTVSFWAKSMLEDALESVEVLYSTTGTKVADFTSLGTFNDVPYQWKQYYFTVPEGALYFAIRAISRDGYILMIDDVNFTPEGNASTLTIDGYNIYRDGKRINEETVSGTSFTDTLPDNATHTYTVTTLYRSRGESKFSNEATPELSGIEGVEAAGATVVGTYTTAGVEVKGEPAPGVYIRRYSDGTVRKVHIR